MGGVELPGLSYPSIAGKDFIGKITVNKLDNDRILLDRATSCCDGGGA